MRFTANRFRHLGRAFLPRHPAQAIALGFGTAIVVGTLVLMLPISKVGPGGAGPLEALFTATSAVCVTGLAVVDTADLLDDVRPGGHPVPDPARRLRHHVLRLPAGRDHGPPAGPEIPHPGRRRNQEHRLRRREIGAARSPAHHRDGRVVRRAAAGPAVRAWLRAFLRTVALAGVLPFGLGLQQRRIRPVQRQPHRVRGRSVDLHADCAGHHHRRPRLPGALRTGTPLPQAPALDHEHQAGPGRHGHPSCRGNRIHQRPGVEQPQDPWRPVRGRQVAGRVLPIRHDPNRRIQLPGHGPDGSGDVAGHGHPHVHRRRPGGHRRRPEDHHLRRPVLHPAHRNPGRGGGQRLRQAASAFGAPRGNHDRPAWRWRWSSAPPWP